MKIRDAILKAADWIERNPALFNFWNSDVPPGCGTPGCALGWVSYFHGGYSGEAAGKVCNDILAPGSWGGVFYNRMDELAGSNWTKDNIACAAGLRLYADKYHPAEATCIPGGGFGIKTTGIDSVKAIFTSPVANPDRVEHV